MINECSSITVQNSLSKELKMMIKVFMWNVLLYGAETWFLDKGDIKRLVAMELWIWRRMEEIS